MRLRERLLLQHLLLGGGGGGEQCTSSLSGDLLQGCGGVGYQQGFGKPPTMK